MRWEFRPRKVLHVHRNSVLCCDSQQDFLSSCEQRDAAGGDADGAFIGLAREGRQAPQRVHGLFGGCASAVRAWAANGPTFLRWPGSGRAVQA